MTAPSFTGAAPELVNPVPAEAIPAWARAMETTFLSNPNGPDADRRRGLLRDAWEPERAWGVRDRGRWVGTLRTETRSMTVPAEGAGTRELAVDALTNVTVAATHRRQGLMRRMLEASLRAARDRGDALSALIAAEWPIYGSFGYAPATLSADYVLHRSRSGAQLAGDPVRLRQVERDGFGEVAHRVFAEARSARAGQMDRSPQWWDRVLGRAGHSGSSELPHNFFVHDGDAGPDGLLAWSAGGQFGLLPPLDQVTVWTLTSASDAAYRDMWAYLSGLDGVDEVRVALRPIDEPVRWLLADGRTLLTTRVVDLVWVRLLDVPAALSARRYAAPGELVLEVVDPDSGGFAAGRYVLRADGAEVECHPTEAPADLEITQRALASMYLGGFRLENLRLAGAAVEHRAGAVRQADVMFSTPLAPWNVTWF
jgi:predicted acetyltransferase